MVFCKAKKDRYYVEDEQGQGSCAQCPTCDFGKGRKYSRRYESGIRRGPYGDLDCYPCIACKRGFFNDKRRPRCQRCRMNCDSLHRHIQRSCGGPSDAICGSCKSGYTDIRRNVDFPCRKLDTASTSKSYSQMSTTQITDSHRLVTSVTGAQQHNTTATYRTSSTDSTTSPISAVSQTTTGFEIPWSRHVPPISQNPDVKSSPVKTLDPRDVHPGGNAHLSPALPADAIIVVCLVCAVLVGLVGWVVLDGRHRRSCTRKKKERRIRDVADLDKAGSSKLEMLKNDQDLETDFPGGNGVEAERAEVIEYVQPSRLCGPTSGTIDPSGEIRPYPCEGLADIGLRYHDVRLKRSDRYITFISTHLECHLLYLVEQLDFGDNSWVTDYNLYSTNMENGISYSECILRLLNRWLEIRGESATLGRLCQVLQRTQQRDVVLLQLLQQVPR